SVAIGFVADVGDALDRLLADQFGDPLDELGLVDLIRNLRHDDVRAIALPGDLHLRPRAHDDGAPPGEVGLLDAGAADDVSAGREVGPGDELEELALPLGQGRRTVALTALDEPDGAFDDLPHVVRRNVRGHADG